MFKLRLEGILCGTEMSDLNEERRSADAGGRGGRREWLEAFGTTRRGRQLARSTAGPTSCCAASACLSSIILTGSDKAVASLPFSPLQYDSLMNEWQHANPHFPFLQNEPKTDWSTQNMKPTASELCCQYRGLARGWDLARFWGSVTEAGRRAQYEPCGCPGARPRRISTEPRQPPGL